MKYSSLRNTYFFDLPLSDVFAAGCAALRMIYYGDDSGASVSRSEEVIDLDKVQSFQISLKHRSVQPLSAEYDYYLVYNRRNEKLNLWNNRFWKKFPGLAQLIRRVKVSTDPSIQPVRHSKLYVKSNRPVYYAKYDAGAPINDYVPRAYSSQFDELFEGFLVRCDRDFPIEAQFLDAQGSDLTSYRHMKPESNATPSVRIYTDAQTAKEVLAERMRGADLKREVKFVSLREGGGNANLENVQISKEVLQERMRLAELRRKLDRVGSRGVRTLANWENEQPLEDVEKSA